MAFESREGSIRVPITDVVSFSFKKQIPYNEEKSLLIDADEPSKRLTASTYPTLIRRLVAGLKAFGLQDGDCVLCHVGNAYFYPALFMGIVGAGGVWCGSNPANQRFEIDHFVQLGEPRFIITNPEALPTILDVCDQRGIPHKNIIVLDVDALANSIDNLSFYDHCSDIPKITAATRPFTDLLRHGEQSWRIMTSEVQVKNTPAVYFPTSGTTGLPKLAMVSHYNLVAHHLMLHQSVPYQTTRLMSLPLFHLFATSYTFIQPSRHGHTTYIMKRFNLDNYLQYLDRYQITETYMAPPMLFAMLKSPHDVRHLIKTVRYAGCGGAPIDAESLNKMRALMHSDATLSSIWGMTEIGVATSFRHGENDTTGAVGRLMRGMEGKLVDSEGNTVMQDGEPGELHIRTDGVMLGYRGLDFEEDEKQWFRTGDVCCLREGKLYIVGRAKELIKVKGWQVAPAELEAVLLQHSEVLDAAVVGTVATDGINEVPRAYVIRQKKTHERDMVTAEELYAFTRERLASYKALDGGVCFVEAIPRTASGKIQRSKLSRMDQYRRSVTTFLLAAGAGAEMRDKIAGIKDTAMREVETAPQQPISKIETTGPPRWSPRLNTSSLSRQSSQATTTSGSLSEYSDQTTSASSTSSQEPNMKSRGRKQATRRSSRTSEGTSPDISPRRQLGPTTRAAVVGGRIQKNRPEQATRRRSSATTTRTLAAMADYMMTNDEGKS